MAVRIDEAGLTRIFPEIEQIGNVALRRGVIAIWLEIAAECAWERFEDIPKNLDSERHRRLTDHIRGVTQMALALAELGKSRNGAAYDRDALIAACLLHDVSKPVECEPDPEGKPSGGPVLPARKSALGAHIQHALYATHKCFAHGLPLAVAHVVNTHTHQSGMRSRTVEGAYLFYADYAESDSAIIPAGGRSFLGRWEMH